MSTCIDHPALFSPYPSPPSIQQWQNDQFLLANKYPRVWEFALILTIMGAIGYHCIQLPYNPYITKVGPPVRQTFIYSRCGAASLTYKYPRPPKSK